jgi:hypothetical protein
MRTIDARVHRTAWPSPAIGPSSHEVLACRGFNSRIVVLSTWSSLDRHLTSSSIKEGIFLGLLLLKDVGVFAHFLENFFSFLEVALPLIDVVKRLFVLESFQNVLILHRYFH